MLVAIQSNAFKCKNIYNGMITFHPGLNTIIGYNNSVGKSLLLFAIDFAYGGNDYLTADDALINAVGHHEIKFVHNIFGKNHTYVRSTKNPTIIKEISNDAIIKHWDSQQFNSYLKLSLNDSGQLLLFRELVGPFSRIHLKNSNNVTAPMHYYSGQKQSNEVESLLKTYHIYEKYMYEKETLKKDEDNLKKFKGARELKLVETITKDKKKEYEERILQLKKKKDELKGRYENGLVTLDDIQMDELKELRKQLKELRRQKSIYESKIDDITIDASSIADKTIGNYNELKKFFPESEFNELSAVQDYAKKLAKITREEKKESIEEYTYNLQLINENITNIENEIKQIIPNKKIPTAILDEYSKIDAEINSKEKALERESLFEKYGQRVKTSDENLKLKLSKVIPEFTNDFNKMLKTDSLSIFENLSSPVLYINEKTSNSYNLHTASDIGNASTTRGLIIFDMLALKNTSVPYVIHDGFITNTFVIDNMKKILNYYVNVSKIIKNKQIFLCLEKVKSFPMPLREMALSYSVIELDDNEKSLYGIKWNTNKNN